MGEVQVRIGGKNYTLTSEYVGHADNALRYVVYVITNTDGEAVLETMVSFSSQWAIVQRKAGRVPDDPTAFREKLEELAAGEVERSLREGKRQSALFITADRPRV